MATWIDFKELREALSFDEVLRFYGVELKEKKGQYHGFCPLPTHEGKRRSPSFSVNPRKGVWQCFGCGAKGNIIEFAARMEGLDPDKGTEFRKAALKLHERFVRTAPEESSKENAPSPPKGEKEPAEGRGESNEVVANAPLNFTLKHLDPDHPYLSQRGLTQETVTYFGLGHTNRGILAGRIAIPIHDREGNLVGYAGRIVDDSSIGEEVPKYKFPPQREREGKTYVFRKSELVYNLHRQERPVSDLIVVEGFPAVWWLHQAGFPYTVAIMGSSISERQIELVTEAVQTNGRIWLVPDGDEAGEKCAKEALPRLADKRFARWVKLSKGKQPTDYAPNDLASLLSSEASQ